MFKPQYPILTQDTRTSDIMVSAQLCAQNRILQQFHPAHPPNFNFMVNRLQQDQDRGIVSSYEL